MIKNDAVLNEEIDPKLVRNILHYNDHSWLERSWWKKGLTKIFFLQMIIKLKQEIQQLKDELAMSSGMEYKGELTEDDIER